MTGPATVRAPWSWITVVVGLVLQTVAVVGAVVLLVGETVHRHRLSESKGGFTQDGFLDGIGSFIAVVVAFVVGLFALTLVVALVLSARPGGRRQAGLILGVCLLLPVGWGVVGVFSAGAGALEIAGGLGVLLVLVGSCVPATWRFAKLPRAVPAGSSYSGGPPAA